MTLDTNSLIVWAIGAVLIAVGLPLFFIADYLSAEDSEKKTKARRLSIIAIIWVAVGLLLYISVAVRAILK